MKKYFAKYLAVEGEIKDGNRYKLGNVFPILQDGDKELIGNLKDKYEGVKTKKDYVNHVSKPVKLFLCSRDIQVGDTFIDNVGRKWENAEKCYVKVAREANEQNSEYGKGSYKVIGEISKDATWVKDGDEFDEDEVLHNHICYDTSGGFGDSFCFHCSRSAGCDSTDYNYKIKCSNCKKFH